MTDMLLKDGILCHCRIKMWKSYAEIDLCFSLSDYDLSPPKLSNVWFILLTRKGTNQMECGGGGVGSDVK